MISSDLMVASRYFKAKKPTRSLELTLLESGLQYIAGVDEVGRGAWAGPMMTCAVILDLKRHFPKIRDSKTLTLLQRNRGHELILSKSVAHAFGSVSPQEIDELGLTRATALAMRRAVDELCKIQRPDHILTDAFGFEAPDGISVEPILHGDREDLSIAAASVLAKVTRDQLMIRLHSQDPRYGYDLHKGYGTKLHQARILEHGVSEHHRKSFIPERMVVHDGA